MAHAIGAPPPVSAPEQHVRLDFNSCNMRSFLILHRCVQGLERDVHIDLELVNNLRTLDALVYEVQLAGADIASLEKLSTLDQESTQPLFYARDVLGIWLSDNQGTI